jgi:hypothetical protein
LARQLPLIPLILPLLCISLQFEFLGNRRSELSLHRQKGFPMNCRFIRCIAFLVAIFTVPAAIAQTDPLQPEPVHSSLLLEPNLADSSSPLLLRPVSKPPTKPTPTLLSQHVEKKFLFFSAGVYTAAMLDMHQTLAVRSSPWWYETDPLAKPFVRLPAPAYYAAGLALATGVNWLSWKMSHSRRWHKLAPIPQVLSITGNLYGFHTNRFPSQ